MINIVLRHEYQGVEVSAAYEDTSDLKAPSYRGTLTAGLGLNDGQTQILFSASYAKENPITERDRGYFKRYRDAALRYDPTFLQVPSFPTVATTPNIFTSSGTPLPGLGTASFTSVAPGYVGGGGLAPFVARAGVMNVEQPDGPVFTPGFGKDLGLTGAPLTRNSLSLSIRHAVTKTLEVFTQLDREDTRVTSDFYNPLTLTIPAGGTNPFGIPVRVAFVPTEPGLVGQLIHAQTVEALRHPAADLQIASIDAPRGHGVAQHDQVGKLHRSGRCKLEKKSSA